MDDNKRDGTDDSIDWSKVPRFSAPGNFAEGRKYGKIEAVMHTEDKPAQKLKRRLFWGRGKKG